MARIASFYSEIAVGSPDMRAHFGYGHLLRVLRLCLSPRRRYLFLHLATKSTGPLDVGCLDHHRWTWSRWQFGAQHRVPAPTRSQPAVGGSSHGGARSLW